MKTPDEIKRGLEFCSTTPYPKECIVRCAYADDALSYIRELEVKVAKYEKPLRPMTLEEVVEKSKNIYDNIVWLEYPDEEDGDDTECVPALVSNISRIFTPGIQSVKFLMWPKYELVFPVTEGTEYGGKWRCWTRRPTDEEREAAEWGEKRCGGSCRDCEAAGKQMHDIWLCSGYEEAMQNEEADH